jgi:small conductance mechanosensitive channel
MKEYFADLTQLDHLLTRYVIPFGWKILGAIAVWIFGSILVKWIQKFADVALRKRNVDPTLVTYSKRTLGWVLKALLILAIMGVFGIETTSFSAILAAAGVAIGVAWSGLLSNFAAGVFLILLRPFKVGEVISAAGVTGTVIEIGIFATTIDNGDNLRVFVGNNKLFSDNILNYSTNAYRLAAFKVQVAHEVNPIEAMDRLKKAISQLQGIERTPGVTAEITEFNTFGTLISVKVPCHNSVYSDVLANGNKVIYDAVTRAHYPKIETKMVLIQPV